VTAVWIAFCVGVACGVIIALAAGLFWMLLEDRRHEKAREETLRRHYRGDQWAK